MNPQFHALQKSFAKTGVLKVSTTDYITHRTNLFGHQAAPSGVFTAKKLTAAPTKSDVTVINEAPNGFGHFVTWVPEEEKIAVVLFLSAADFLGAMIKGVTKFDTIEIISATGQASFSEDTENEGAASFIGMVGAGATITAGIFGAPELAPVIKSAEEFAKSQFKEKKVKTKRRDPFGVDPGTAHKARQEGGVAISLPNGVIGQIFTSGGDSLEAERWIKKPGDRTDKNLPEHMKGQGAFFLQAGVKNLRQVRHDGDILIYPWDHKFEDNFGFYRLDIILERHDSSIFDEDVE